MAYEHLEPFGERRADLRAAIIASTIANVNRGKDAPPIELSTFLPNFDKEVDEELEDEDESEAPKKLPGEQSVEHQLAFIQMFAAQKGLPSVKVEQQ